MEESKKERKESQSWRVPSGEEDEKAKQSKAKQSEAKQRPKKKKAMSAELAELVESLDLDVDLDDDTIEEIDLSERILKHCHSACARCRI